MTPERIDELWSRYFSDGTLSSAEQRELQAALEADPELRARFLEDRQIHGLLRGRPLEAERDGFAESFQNRLSLESQSNEFLATVRERMKREGAASHRPATRRARLGSKDRENPWSAFIWAAAALVLAMLLYASISEPAPAPGGHPVDVSRTKKDAVPPRVEPAPAPKEPERPAPPEEPKRPPPPVVERQPVTPPLPDKPVVQDPPVVETPKPPPPEKPAPAPEAPVKPLETRVAAAGVVSVAAVDGEAVAVRGEDRRILTPGTGIAGGESLECVGPKSTVTLLFPDGTEIRMEGPARIASIADRAGKGGIGKWIDLGSGSLLATVKKQPVGQAMVVDTPNGSAKVLGTTLRLFVEKGRTTLDALEGKVQLKNLEGRTVEVITGHQAVAAAGVKLKASPMLIGGIVLQAEDGKPSNREWIVAKDARASSGVALDSAVQWDDLEAKSRFAKGTLGYVEFTFTAEANLDYHVWIRGACEGARDPSHDGLVLEAKNSRFSSPCVLNKARTDIGLFTGYFLRPGYWWAGSTDFTPEGKDGKQGVLSVRFNTGGAQVLRLYAIEPPMRVDTIWLTPTQSTWPDPEAVPAHPGR